MEIEALVADAPNLSFRTLRVRGEESLFPVIHAVDKNLIVFGSDLPGEMRRAYIICGAISKALSMIPSQPPRFEFEMAYTNRALITRRHDAGGVDDDEEESYALVHMGKKALVAGENLVTWQDVLSLCRPSSSSPWELTKTANLPGQCLADESSSSFVADVTFSFHGRAFWADLLCGFLTCSCGDLLSDDVDRVDLGFIDLPPNCHADIRHTGTLARPEAHRTTGYAGKSIEFVSIDIRLNRGNRKDDGMEATASLHMGERARAQRAVSPWNQPELKKAKLPERRTTAMYPILSTREEHVLYLMLGEYRLGSTGIAVPKDVRRCLRVDMVRGRILSSASIPVAYNFAPIILGSDFTSYLSHV